MLMKLKGNMHLHIDFPTHLFAHMICDFAFILNTAFIFNSEELGSKQLCAIPIQLSVLQVYKITFHLATEFDWM